MSNIFQTFFGEFYFFVLSRNILMVTGHVKEVNVIREVN